VVRDTHDEDSLRASNGSDSIRQFIGGQRRSSFGCQHLESRHIVQDWPNVNSTLEILPRGSSRFLSEVTLGEMSDRGLCSDWDSERKIAGRHRYNGARGS